MRLISILFCIFCLMPTKVHNMKMAQRCSDSLLYFTVSCLARVCVVKLIPTTREKLVVLGPKINVNAVNSLCSESSSSINRRQSEDGVVSTWSQWSRCMTMATVLRHLSHDDTWSGTQDDRLGEARLRDQCGARLRKLCVSVVAAFLVSTD